MRRVVIVGGVAGGATAAARANRLAKCEITVVERGPDVSFANCGLPYYIGREIQDRHKLSLHTPDSLSQMIGSKIRTMTEAIGIDRDNKKLIVRSVDTRKEEVVPYDKLILSPGAAPLIPPLEGLRHERVKTLRNLQDMDKLDALVHNESCKRVVVIGAGFIGLEIVEQMVHLKKHVTLVEAAKAVLPQADEEIGCFLHEPLRRHGVQLHLGDPLLGVEHGESHSVVKLSSGARVDADLIVLCIGVAPDTSLAKESGLFLAPKCQIIVNDYMQTNDPSIYAVGDAVETRDLVFPERRAWVALGNVANMQARIAADHAVLGRSIPYPGSVGSAIVRAFDRVLAITGWSERRLKAAGIPYRTTTITALHHAGYYPGGEPITMKITFDPTTGRVLGGQAVGTHGVDKRVDVVAMAIQGRLTIEDISLSQLTYSPPFGLARDVVNVAGLAARNQKDGLYFPVNDTNPEYGSLIDIRTPDNAEEGDIPGAMKLMQKEMPEKADKMLDRSQHYTTVCDWGKTAFFAARELLKRGYHAHTIDGGWRVQKARNEMKSQSQHK